MLKIKAFLQLVRWVNLYIMLLTQWLVYAYLLLPTFAAFEIKIENANFVQILVLIANVLIAAGGYVINDYFDVKLDLVNKPNKVIVGRFVKRRWAIIIHLCLTIIGITIGIKAALMAGIWQLSLLFILAAALLWRYSEIWKRQLIIGNLIISILTALLVAMPALFEAKRLAFLFHNQPIAFKAIYISVLLYASFAFWLTLIREIVKDIEDREGDVNYNCRTLPIAIGHKLATYVAIGLLILPIISIGYLQVLQVKSNQWIGASYLLFAVQFPLIIVAKYLFSKMEKYNYSKASLWLKIAMFGGVFSMLVFHLIRKYA